MAKNPKPKGGVNGTVGTKQRGKMKTRIPFIVVSTLFALLFLMNGLYGLIVHFKIPVEVCRNLLIGTLLSTLVYCISKDDR